MYVADATPLIYLGKADALDILDGFDVVTTEGVYREVVEEGKRAEEPDARRVESYGIEAREPPANDLYRRLPDSAGVSDVDVEVLALADHLDATALVDDRRMRKVAEVEDVPVRGTAYLLVRSIERCDVSGDGAREVLDDMVDSGWYCSTSFYSKITKRIDDVA